MAVPRACWCRTSTSGNRRSGSRHCSSPNETRRGSGSCGATTCTGIPGKSNAIPGIDVGLGAARAVKLVWQLATVAAIETRAPTVKTFFFRLPRPLSFIPGQHMDVRLTAPDGYEAQRSYSIASAPDGTDQIELAIELLQGGEVSLFFFDTVAVGDEI